MNNLSNTTLQERPVVIKHGATELRGMLTIPEMALGTIVLAHGSGSHRHSRANRRIAQQLHQSAFATLLINLLTPEEEDIDMRSQHYRFDVKVLAQKLFRATEWLRHNPETCDFNVGYFNANTESAAALVAVAENPDAIRAVVSRSGRVDLVGSALARITTPTLLIVGSGDFPCIGMNQDALAQIQSSQKQLAIVPGATHLFEEQGALEHATQLAIHWFNGHLISPSLVYQVS